MFSADLSTRDCGGQAVVMLSGELDVMDAATVAATLSAIAAGGAVVIVDLAGLKFLDASGLAALMLAREHARAAGGKLLLAAPQRQALLVLTAARLADVLPFHACVEDAARIAEQSQAAAPVTARPALPAVI
jgi:anti-sigma B factor antagonist